MTTSYWLAESSEPLRSRRTSGPVDAIVVGAGVTGCSCALALAGRGLSVRLHEAREVASGASGRNGGFALRGGATSYVRARDEHGRGAGPAPVATLGACARRDGGAGRRRSAPHGQPPPRRRRGRAVGARGRARGASRRRLRGRMARPAPAAARPAVRRRARAPARRRRSIPRAGCVASPAKPCDAGVEIVEGSRVELEALDAEAIVVATDGLTSDLLPELSRTVVPGERADARHGAARSPAVRPAALRPAWLRLLAAAPGRPSRRRRQARSRASRPSSPTSTARRRSSRVRSRRSQPSSSEGRSRT